MAGVLFPPDSRAGHGHHTSSAILAHEAFNAAGNPDRYPEQLDKVSIWQPKSIYWNTHPWFYRNRDFDKTGMISVNVGQYNPLVGKSYTEIAAESRSMHKSQGFGSTGTRGDQIDYLEYVDGDSLKGELFQSIKTSWSRVENGEKIGEYITQALESFDPEEPSGIVPLLMQAYSEMQKMKDEPWVDRKIDSMEKVIAACLGLCAEITTDHYAVRPGDSITMKVEVINRSSVPVRLLSFNETASEDGDFMGELMNNQPFMTEFNILIPDEMRISQPYWLKEPGSLGMFNVADREQIGKPQNEPVFPYEIIMEVDGIPFTYNTQAVFKRNDPVDGESYRPFVITPPVFINIEENVMVFANGDPKPVHITLKAGTDSLKGVLKAEIPKGWKVEPEQIRFSLNNKYEEQLFSMLIYPPKKQSDAEFKLFAEIDGKRYDKGLVTIEYDHIPTQMVFPEANAKVVKVELEKKGSLIGYIMGAGDEIPSSLEQIGYTVELLENGDITENNLKRYDAVILGIRALNTIDRLRFDQPVLMDYVKNGGTMIVQYNTSHRLVTEEFSPFPITLSRDRVSEENAEVKILKPDHPVMNYPNKISDQDFSGWVQERGLYFPTTWSEEYAEILSSHDKGEDEKTGGLLVTQYGNGFYIYTGYSWFRELPAGVPGAYRIFTNLISIGK
jgi:hypothetical protein